MIRDYSRRQFLRLGAWAVLVDALVQELFERTAEAQQKVPKTMVQYQDHPKGGHDCAGCSNFLPPRACRVVAGTISPRGWCTIWTPK